MYKGFRFPREIISHCVWLYHRFPLSFREIELLMLARGIVVSYETIRTWCTKFGPEYAAGLRRRQPQPGDKWHLDEVFIKVNGVRKYLWRAVDQHGNVIDILIQSKREGSDQVLPEDPETAWPQPAGAGHRPTRPLPGRPPDHHFEDRAPAIEISQQSGRELPSTDPPTQTGDERLPLGGLSPEISVLVQPHLSTLSAAPAPDDRHRLPHRDTHPIPGVESGHRTGPRGLTNRSPMMPDAP